MLIALKLSNFGFAFTFLKVDNKTFVLILKSAVTAIERFPLCLLPTVLPKRRYRAKFNDHLNLMTPIWPRGGGKAGGVLGMRWSHDYAWRGD